MILTIDPIDHGIRHFIMWKLSYILSYLLKEYRRLPHDYTVVPLYY